MLNVCLTCLIQHSALDCKWNATLINSDKSNDEVLKFCVQNLYCKNGIHDRQGSNYGQNCPCCTFLAALISCVCPSLHRERGRMYHDEDKVYKLAVKFMELLETLDLQTIVDILTGFLQRLVNGSRTSTFTFPATLFCSHSY